MVLPETVFLIYVNYLHVYQIDQSFVLYLRVEIGDVVTVS